MREGRGLCTGEEEQARWCNPAKIRPPLQFPDLPRANAQRIASSHPPFLFPLLAVRSRRKRLFTPIFIFENDLSWREQRDTLTNLSENSAFLIRKSSYWCSTLRILPCGDKRKVYLERNCYVLRFADSNYSNSFLQSSMARKITFETIGWLMLIYKNIRNNLHQ